METATQGLYTYRTRNYDGTFNQVHVLVEVIGETARSYRIRLLQPLYGHQIGKLMTVRRHNVQLPERSTPKPERSTPKPDCSNAWWND